MFKYLLVHRGRKRMKFCLFLVFSLLLFSCYSRRIETKLVELEAESIRNKENLELIRKDLENLRKVLLDIEDRVSIVENKLNRLKENAINSERILEEISRTTKELERLQAKLRELEEKAKDEKTAKLGHSFPVSETEANLLVSEAKEYLFKGETDKAYGIVKALSSRGYSSHETKFIAGEVMFRRQEYKSAIREWLSIIQDEDNVKDKSILTRTYLRLANAFSRIGDNQNAELMLQAIISKFPDSPEAKTAKDLIQQLKNKKR